MVYIWSGSRMSRFFLLNQMKDPIQNMGCEDATAPSTVSMSYCKCVIK